MRKYDEKTSENAANETTGTLMKGRGGFRFVLKSRHCGVNRLFCYTSLFLHCHWTDLSKGLCWELWAELLQIMLKYSPKLWICLLAMGAYFSHGIKKVCDIIMCMWSNNLHLAILCFSSSSSSAEFWRIHAVRRKKSELWDVKNSKKSISQTWRL